MFKFFNVDLKNNLLECIKYIKNAKGKNELYIYSESLNLVNYDLDKDLQYLQLLKCVGEEYTDDELDILGWDIQDKNEIIIDSNYDIDITFYDDDYNVLVSIGELINCIEKCKISSFDKNGVLIFDKNVIFRVYFRDINNYDYLEYFPDFKKNVKYKDKDLEFSISNINSNYAIMLYFQDIADEYNPPIMDDDLFIEISSDNKLELDDESIYEIYNAYIFEIFASYNIKIMLNPRIKYNFEETESKQFDDAANYRLRPLLFSKGMKDIISLFNNAEGYGIDDSSIVEYVKVIEYVSQTVIRMEITEKARKKLNSEEALNPDAIFIKELENMFLEYNSKYSTDRNAIKATIIKCCDIKQLAKYSPNFLKKLSALDKKLANTKSNTDEVINSAYEELCNSISDTRNELSHAKANYSPNGNECPNNEKNDYIVLLRHICIQVIRWFSNVSEVNRIINEEN